MSDPKTPPIDPKAPALSDATLAELKLKQELADKAAKIAALKAEARKQLAAALKAQREAEEILYGDWKPGSSATRPVKIPRANFVSGAQPKINGRELAGIVEMTYDAYRGMMHQITYREWQERAAKEGYFKGVRVQDAWSGEVRFVDNWDPKAQGLVGADGR